MKHYGAVVDALDVATKAYVDAEDQLAAYPSFQPPSGYNVAPPGALSSAAVTQTATQNGRQFWHPFYVGVPFTTAGPTVSVTTALSGTPAGYSFLIGLYAADPTTRYPDTTQLLRSASLTQTDLQSTGHKNPSWGSTLALTQGLYWTSSLLIFTTIGTAPAFTSFSNVSWFLPFAGTSGPSTGVARGLYLSGQTGLKTTATVPTGFTTNGAADGHVVNLRAA